MRKQKYRKPKFIFYKFLVALFERFVLRGINNQVGKLNHIVTKKILKCCRNGCENCYSICKARGKYYEL